MKEFKLFIFSLAILAISSCSKTESPTTGGGNNNGGGTTTPTYYITCKVNGVLTDFKSMNLVKDDPNNAQEIFLIGAKGEKEFPTITFALKYKAPGWVDGLTYQLDENDFVNTCEYKNQGLFIFKSTATPASASSGLNIKFDKFSLAKDQFVSGTFSGTLQLEENVTSVLITEGKFKVQFLN